MLSKPVPRLKQFASLWTLTYQPTQSKQWSLEEKFKQTKKAGFDSISGGILPEVVPLCEKHSLDYVCEIDANIKTFEERLRSAFLLKPVRINVQLCDHNTLPKEAVQVWLKIERLACQLGLEVDLEVHRDTCTETPEKTYEIAALYKKATGNKLRFCWDFSHIAVVKHIHPPYAKRLLEQPDLVKFARQMHFRPFNGHHCQIPATDGKGNRTPEFDHYLEFIDELLACWIKGAKGGETLHVCPEYGPIGSGYCVSTFPNVWKDAVLLSLETRKLWNKNLLKFGWK